MRRVFVPTRPDHWAIACVALLVVGCSSDGGKKTLGEQLQLTTRTEDAKPWVAATRPNGVEFIPVGVTPPDRPTLAMAPAQLAAATQELDALRVANVATANRADVLAPGSQSSILAEQKRRLAKAGLLGKAKLPTDKDVLDAAAKSRAFANRPLPGTPASVPAEQPTSWPVPENRRIKRKGFADCDVNAPPEDCKELPSQ
jgi:hypothetical protein